MYESSVLFLETWTVESYDNIIVITQDILHQARSIISIYHCSR